MKLGSVELGELPDKHYATEVFAEVNDGTFRIDICGYGPKPSKRELDNGWQMDYGMDHVESEEHLFLANLIVEALKNYEHYE
jgi:hypothetical protein